MNAIHSLALLLTSFALLVPLVAAEEQKAEKKRPAAGAENIGQILPQELLDKLNLSAEQKEKVAKLRKEFEDKNKDALDKVKESAAKAKETMEKARQDKDKDGFRKAGEQMREATEAVQKLRKDLEGQLSSVLNDDQKKKLQEAAGKEAGRPSAPKPGERPGKGPAGREAGGVIPPMLQERLKLTDEQKEKLKQLDKEFEEKAKGILTDEQKKQLDEFKKGGRRKDKN